MVPLPEPTPRSSWPDDEHEVCPPPCGGLMVFDAATGRLRCDECGMQADDAAAKQAVTW